MEFKEYQNPEETDYDVTGSLKVNEKEKNNKSTVDYSYMLVDLMGCIIEDIDEIDEKALKQEFGITKQEYIHPNKEVLLKVKRTLLENQKAKNHSSR